jgi:hypothetical protein
MGRLYPMATAVVGLWVAVAAISVFAPDLISGSEQEHVPIAAITTWLWGTIATGFVLSGAAFPTRDPTTVPIASGPMAGAIATGFACLAAAWSAVSERRAERAGATG